MFLTPVIVVIFFGMTFLLNMLIIEEQIFMNGLREVEIFGVEMVKIVVFHPLVKVISS